MNHENSRSQKIVFRSSKITNFKKWIAICDAESLNLLPEKCSWQSKDTLYSLFQYQATIKPYAVHQATTIATREWFQSFF